MAATQQSLDEERSNFNSSFDEDFTRTEPTEDQSFGLDVEAVADPDAAADAGAPVDADGEPADPPADGTVVDAPAGEAEQSAEDEPTDPKEIQRKRSWEGRLRAREKELEARAAELEANAAPATPAAPAAPDVPDADDSSATSTETQATAEALEQIADTTTDAGVAQTTGDLADAVADGSMTAEQAMKVLSEDFGEDFVKMIRAIAGAEGRTAATQEVTTLRGDMSGVISTIADSRAREHFETIAEAHPDFNDVGQSEAFKSWAAEDPARQEIANGGSARQIIRMLGEFKAAAPAAPAGAAEDLPASDSADSTSLVDGDPDADEDLDAAEGVRSSNAGMTLPEAPAPAGGYEDAWEQF